MYGSYSLAPKMINQYVKEKKTSAKSTSLNYIEKLGLSPLRYSVWDSTRYSTWIWEEGRFLRGGGVSVVCRVSKSV